MQHQIYIATKVVCVWYTYIHVFVVCLRELCHSLLFIHWLDWAYRITHSFVQSYSHSHSPPWRENTYKPFVTFFIIFSHFFVLCNIQSVAHFHFMGFHFCSLDWSFLASIWSRQDKRKLRTTREKPQSLKIAHTNRPWRVEVRVLGDLKKFRIFHAYQFVSERKWIARTWNFDFNHLIWFIAIHNKYFYFYFRSHNHTPCQIEKYDEEFLYTYTA